MCVCVSCLSTHCGNVGPGFKVADRPLPPQFTYEREKLEAITPSVGVLFYPSKWQIWKRMCKEVFGWAYTITNFTKLCHLQNYRVVYSICLQPCPTFKHHSPHVAKAGVTRTGCLKPQEMGHDSFKSNIIKYGWGSIRENGGDSTNYQKLWFNYQKWCKIRIRLPWGLRICAVKIRYPIQRRHPISMDWGACWTWKNAHLPQAVPPGVATAAA